MRSGPDKNTREQVIRRDADSKYLTDTTQSRFSPAKTRQDDTDTMNQLKNPSCDGTTSHITMLHAIVLREGEREGKKTDKKTDMYTPTRTKDEKSLSYHKQTRRILAASPIKALKM